MSMSHRSFEQLLNKLSADHVRAILEAHDSIAGDSGDICHTVVEDDTEVVKFNRETPQMPLLEVMSKSNLDDFDNTEVFAFARLALTAPSTTPSFEAVRPHTAPPLRSNTPKFGVSEAAQAQTGTEDDGTSHILVPLCPDGPLPLLPEFVSEGDVTPTRGASRASSQQYRSTGSSIERLSDPEDLDCMSVHPPEGHPSEAPAPQPPEDSPPYSPPDSPLTCFDVEDVQSAGLGDWLTGNYYAESFVIWVTEIYWWFFHELEEPERVGCLARLINHHSFGTLCMLVILSNSVFQAHTSTQEMINIGKNQPQVYVTVEMCFLCFYVIELILKIRVHGRFFFLNQEWAWNWFDFVLVLQALFDTVCVLFFPDVDGASLTFARMLRLMKLGKIFRMFRALKFLRELRVMVMSIAGSAMTMFWALVMLCLILFIFSLVIIQTMSGYLVDQVITGTDVDPEITTAIQTFFGNVPVCMLTLYQTTSGGIDWVTVYEVIELGGTFLQLTFIFFLAFFNFAVFNILSGIFLEKALANSEPDRESQAIARRRKDREDMAVLTTLLQSMDFEGNGKISLAEFDSHLQDDRVRAYMALVGIDVRDAQMFYKIIFQISGQKDLLIEDFVNLCCGMKGNATGIDMAGLKYELKVMRREMNDAFRPNFLPPIPGTSEASMSMRKSATEQATRDRSQWQPPFRLSQGSQGNQEETIPVSSDSADGTFSGSKDKQTRAPSRIIVTNGKVVRMNRSSAAQKGKKSSRVGASDAGFNEIVPKCALALYKKKSSSSATTAAASTSSSAT